MNSRPLLKPGLKALKQLDVICRQKFKANAGKLGEWLAASHIERLGTGDETGGGGGGGGTVPPPENAAFTQANPGDAVEASADPVPGGLFKVFARPAGSPDAPVLLTVA